ncbi:transcription initiation factor TFIID subunit 4-like [Gadus morhua]|uniref:transcription initiation factor TFIID subunit 4-like n=1 Tax=Gadus morhua TaxID=8049 RepID=UPI0011B3A65C|nr:transcription initiation factor TFIID subunit 4-like [Gadus morhua]
MCPGWIHILHTFSCLSWITRKYWGPVAVLNCVEYGNDLTKSLNFTFRNLVPSAMLVPGHILLLIGEAAETPHPCSFRITSLSVVYAGSSKNDTTVSSLLLPTWSRSFSGASSITHPLNMAPGPNPPSPPGPPPPTRVLSWAIFGTRSPEVPPPTPSPIAPPAGGSSGRTTSSTVQQSGSISAAAAAAANAAASATANASAAASASTTADTSAASSASTTATAVAPPSCRPSWFSSARSPPLTPRAGIPARSAPASDIRDT